MVTKLGLHPALAQSISALIKMRAFFAASDLWWIECRIYPDSGAMNDGVLLISGLSGQAGFVSALQNVFHYRRFNQPAELARNERLTLSLGRPAPGLAGSSPYSDSRGTDRTAGSRSLHRRNMILKYNH